MRSLPANLALDHLRHALADGWRLGAASTAMEYVPEGGGAYHWKVTGADGPPRFVTVDDLDGKDWLGETREAVFGGLSRALDTAAALRHEAGLEFVAAAVPDRDGQRTRRVGERYAVSVFPFLVGRSHPFGTYPNTELRRRALDMITALYQATAVVRETAPRHCISFTGRADLEAFLRDPGLPWDGGPFSAAAHRIFAPSAAELAGPGSHRRNETCP
jgi:spectinomycin phosphotransferase